MNKIFTIKEDKIPTFRELKINKNVSMWGGVGGGVPGSYDHENEKHNRGNGDETLSTGHGLYGQALR